MRRPVSGIEDNRILTPQQKNFLLEFANSDLCNLFRLTGGTALSAFYLEHRLSEDLDFFSTEKTPFYIVEVFLKKLPFVDSILHSRLFDRNIFTLSLNDNTSLKAEFAYYPLRNIEETNTVDNLQIDGFLDILINKLCAIADRVEAKDYVDVYCSIKSSGLSLEYLLKLAEEKCEIKGIRHILESRLIQIPEGVENLHLKVAVKRDEIEHYFKNMTKEIISRKFHLEP